MPRGDAVARGVHVGKARAHPVVHEQRTAGAGRRAGHGRDVRRRPHPDGHDHRVGRDRVAVDQRVEVDHPAANPLEPGAEPQIDAVAAHLVLDQGGNRLVEVRHHPRQYLGHDDGHPPVVQRLDHLEPDVAGAHDDRPADAPGIEEGAKRDGVLEGAHREDPFVVDAGKRRHDRCPARGHDHRVVVEAVLPAVVREVDDVAIGVERRHRRMQAEVDPSLLAEVRRRVRKKLLGPLDEPADVVGKPAHPVRGVATALEHHDLEGRVDPARGRGRRHARCPASYNHESLTHQEPS